MASEGSRNWTKGHIIVKNAIYRQVHYGKTVKDISNDMQAITSHYRQ